jgi:alpha-L-fucosidase 2
MLVQSHEDVIDLLPALPDEWADGAFGGVCTRGGFELDMTWKDRCVAEVVILSKAGHVCRIDDGAPFNVLHDGAEIALKMNEDGSIEFDTVKGGTYKLVRK